jgi:hypothetical protein
MQNEEVLQPVAADGCHAARGFGGAFGFERAPDQKGFADLIAVDLTHQRPGLCSHVDKALMTEPHDRLMHGVRETPSLAAIAYVDGLARLQLAAQNERTQDGVNLLAHRRRAHETDVRKVEPVVDDSCS